MTQVNFPNEGQTLKEEEISTYWEILRPHEPKGKILEEMEKNMVITTEVDWCQLDYNY